jgi:hypothetical protein
MSRIESSGVESRLDSAGLAWTAAFVDALRGVRGGEWSLDWTGLLAIGEPLGSSAPRRAAPAPSPARPTTVAGAPSVRVEGGVVVGADRCEFDRSFDAG